ncbi:adenosylcobinamide-GDP ribazoletransferase [Aceticella autotrophica]|uniref:Adenosylcobinamide-GDP ribazoletransferase n=1 Tax=Aceticella autotrophica TaxID=2755338 RepID=A0A975AX40_9THEO|nr:adenosylcobinamide-GDP ribazoletransferase [Aceticella autotrophica]QSZ28081.1 adenosylcobinamide-GDP ribazoletransferase [Aceticella autotrophica]
MKEIKRLIIALQFMTRIPIPIRIDLKDDDFLKSTAYFPIVGFVVGILSLLIYLLLKSVFPREIVMTVIIAFSYVLIGAFHIDGLADTFDGLFSNKNKEGMLEVMRDSRLGTNGVLAILFMIILRISFLTNIDDSYIMAVLIITPMIGRLSQVLAIMISKSAREGKGLGGLLIGKIGYREFMISAVITLIIGYFIFPIQWLIAITAVVLIMAYLETYYISARIGGMTGDTLGAINELAELTTLAMVYIILR